MQTEGAGQVELGATWLHGIKGHPAYDLAIERGLIDPAEQQRASKSMLSQCQSGQVATATLASYYMPQGLPYALRAA